MRPLFSKQFILTAGSTDTRHAQSLLLQQVEQHSYDQSSCFAIRLALEEALSNAFKHGNRNDPAKTVRLDCTVDSESVLIEIEDKGSGFDPDEVPDPTADENLELPSGRGIVLMRAFMTEVTFHPPGNRVEMRFVKATGGAGPGAGTGAEEDASD